MEMIPQQNPQNVTTAQTPSLLSLPRELRKSDLFVSPGPACDDDIPHPHPLLLVNQQLSQEYAEHLFKFVHLILDITPLVSAARIKNWTPSELITKQLRRTTIVLKCEQPWAKEKDIKEDILRTVGNYIITLRKLSEVNLLTTNYVTPISGIEYECSWFCAKDEQYLFKNQKWYKWTQLVTAIQFAVQFAASKNQSIGKISIRKDLVDSAQEHARQRMLYERRDDRIWSSRVSFSESESHEWYDMKSNKVGTRSIDAKRLQWIEGLLQHWLGDDPPPTLSES
ncbi:hypothetical protein EJ08DRAFT_674109 [Tothia fuscella]|uniref:Uncharacterized protein n=1 Tax=Tothia fuscella TaxID=1048955 RepID=A0A9P4P4C6_9PEZI|nr:hypothetical protein EJ08DRAFT_674109 [Tothia fuscella]